MADLTTDLLSAVPMALAIIKHFEGCRLTAFRDNAGILTIGWGDTDGVHEGQVITQAEADQRLLDRVQEFVKGVVGHLDDAPATIHQLAALISFTYNVGVGAFAGSTLLRLHQAKRYGAAAKQFPLWIHDARGHVEQGLVKRRQMEQALYQMQDEKTKTPLHLGVGASLAGSIGVLGTGLIDLPMRLILHVTVPHDVNQALIVVITACAGWVLHHAFNR